MFVKWPRIENTYQQENIDWWIQRYPELKHETYIITEKIHGSNFQWLIQPNKPIQAGSRNGWLDINGRFNGASIQELLTHEKPLLDMLQEKVNYFGNTYRLYGELFGDGIQKGVRYGKEKRILYFGFSVNDWWKSFNELVEHIGVDHVVPRLSIVHSLADTLKFDPVFDSTILGEPDNTAEGIVIMPLYKTYDMFMLKVKNEAFKERAREPKIRVVDSEVARLQAEFLTYITDNRLQSVFSKQGEIESNQQIGDYLRWLIEDAKEDFLKEFADDFNLLDKSQQRSVFNIGKVGFNLLIQYL